MGSSDPLAYTSHELGMSSFGHARVRIQDRFLVPNENAFGYSAQNPVGKMDPAGLASVQVCASAGYPFGFCFTAGEDSDGYFVEGIFGLGYIAGFALSPNGAFSLGVEGRAFAAGACQVSMAAGTIGGDVQYRLGYEIYQPTSGPPISYPFKYRKVDSGGVNAPKYPGDLGLLVGISIGVGGL